MSTPERPDSDSGAEDLPEGQPHEHGDTPEKEQDAATAPAHPVPAPGEPAGDMWPGVHAVRADADEDDEVTGVDDVALAPPGKPDGEADTRP